MNIEARACALAVVTFATRTTSLVVMPALTNGSLAACRSNARRPDVIDAAQFAAEQRTGAAVKIAMSAGVTFPVYRQKLRLFAVQVALVRSTAHNEAERRIAAMYAVPLDGYTDALTVWGTVNHMVSPAMRIDRDAVKRGHDRRKTSERFSRGFHPDMQTFVFYAD